jgi:hypothetical protein
MRSNEHSKDRQGIWDTSKLPGPESTLHKPLLSLVKGDEKVGGCLCLCVLRSVHWYLAFDILPHNSLLC